MSANLDPVHERRQGIFDEMAIAASIPLSTVASRMDEEKRARFETIEAQLLDLHQYLTYLLGRFNVPLTSTVDLLTAERHIRNKIAERRAEAEPVTLKTGGPLEAHEPRRPNGG
jgi:hypothetical protein